MGLMVEELIGVSTKKEVRSTNAKNVRNTALLEALAKRGYVTSHTTDDGKVKIKILVKKQDLQQILETMNYGTSCNNINNNNGNFTILPASSSLSSSSFERRLYDLKKKKRASQAKEQQPSRWKPALQSIPEEY